MRSERSSREAVRISRSQGPWLAARARVRSALEEWPEKLGLASFVEPDLLRHWHRVLARSRDRLRALPSATGPTVVLLSTLARARKWPARLAILAYALRLRGAKPLIVACDGWLEACGEGALTNFSLEEYVANGSRSFCGTCFGSADPVYRALGLPYHRLSEFERQGSRQTASAIARDTALDDLYALSYQGVHLGPTIESSVLGFLLRSSRPDPDDKMAAALARRYAVASVLLVDAVDALLRQLRPDRLVVPIDVYIEEIPRLVANARGVPAASLDLLCYRDADRWSIGLEAPVPKELAYRQTGPWDKVEMTSERDSRLDAWLSDRNAGRIRYTYKNALADDEQLIGELELDRAVPVVTLFLSTGWEQSTYNDTESYRRNQATFDAIRAAAERPGLQLVIRAHPRERASETRESSADVIRRFYPDLPTNIRLVPAASEINSYALGRLSSAIIVHGSTLGLEMACLGKAVICTGVTPYRSKGFTYEAGSYEEIARYLDSLRDIARRSDARTAAARRFAYYLVFMRELPMPLWYRTGTNEPGIRPWWSVFRTLDDLGAGVHPGLDVICDAILWGKEPYLATA